MIFARRSPWWLPFALLAIALVLILFALVWPMPSHAQTARAATISFQRPTQYTDGTTIATGTAVSYNVYQGAKGSTSKPKVGTITGTSTTISTGLQPGETCWQVSAVINGVESALSNEACKTFPFPTPETVTITVT